MRTMAQFVYLMVVLLLTGCAGMNGGGVLIDDLRAKADQGDKEAQFQLGAAYDQGQGIPKNINEAAAWYRKAAEQGHAGAQNSLGSMYQHGEGVPKDYAEAGRWYEKAVNQDYGEAYTSLGYMYDFGLGVTQDAKKAVNLYQLGAERGSIRAMLNLGVSYWDGKGVSKDLVQAYKWLDLARFYTQESSDMQMKWRVRDALDEVKKEMTDEQINRAKQLTREWDIAHRRK